MDGEQKSYYSVAEAARFLGVTPLTIRRYIYRGLLDSYPTPGGHHRLEAGALSRLQGRRPGGSRCNSPSGGEDLLSCNSRFERLELEVEMLKKQLSVVSHGCVKLKERVDTPFTKQHKVSEPDTIIVLGPGCRACDSLALLAKEVVRELKRDALEVRHIKDMEMIAAYGPLLTPALIMEGSVMVSGVVPSREQLASLLKAKLQ